MKYIGIDLGKDGAIVVLTEEGAIIEKIKTPLIKNPKGRDEYDDQGMRRALLGHIDDTMATIEKAHAFPGKMGGIANFQRGLSFGLWRATLVGLAIPFAVYASLTWQRVMLADLRTRGKKGKISGPDTKQASIIIAARLWPKEDWRRSERAKKAHDGFTDAALLGEYGRRLHRGS